MKKSSNLILTVLLITFIGSCAENITTPDSTTKELTVNSYMLCSQDSIPISSINLQLFSLENNQEKLIEQIIKTSNYSNLLTIRIPRNGLPVKLTAKFVYGLDSQIVKLAPFVICDNMSINILFECISGCLKIKRESEILDSLKGCPIEPDGSFRDILKGQYDEKVLISVCGETSIGDFGLNGYDILNPNAFNIYANLKFTKNDANSFSIHTTNLTDDSSNTTIQINAKQMINFKVKFKPPKGAKDGECFKAILRVESGTCYCEIQVTACTKELPEPSINTCMVAYNQITDKQAVPDNDIFVLGSNQIISLKKKYAPLLPPNPPRIDDGSIYIDVTNSVLIPLPGLNLPNLNLLSGELYNNIGFFTPDQFSNAGLMRQELETQKLLLPSTKIQNGKIENIDDKLIGKVYPFKLNGWYGLLYLTGYNDGTTNVLTHQSFVCFKVLYPLLCD